MAKNTPRQRLRMIRIFFERLSEWDWPDASARNPIFHGDISPRTDPLPKFLNDRDAAKLMAAARAHRIPRYRLVIEMLARTGLRATTASSPYILISSNSSPNGPPRTSNTSEPRND